MRKLKITALLTTIFWCLLISAETQAQGVYGYSSITFDATTNTLTGYASTETDYSTAYYYDAEVQAQIKDESGNVIATSSNVGNPFASTIMNVFQALLCIRYSIISYILVRANYWGCDGGVAYYDYWGFGFSSWGSYWDYGFFSPNRELGCIFGPAIFIATVIADVIECLPVDISCGFSSNKALPTGFRQGKEFPFVSGTDKIEFVCTARHQTGSTASGVLIQFGFGPEVVDKGGHENHPAQRPKGTYSRTSVRTDSNGVARTMYTTSHFGGTTRLTASSPGNSQYSYFDAYSEVPGLQQLPDGENYRKFGSTTTHPSNHYGAPSAINGLQQIADEYKARYYANGWIEPPPGTPIDPADRPIDYYKIHYNDISLKLGGKFEVAGRWNLTGAHDEHRIGINCDTRSRNIPGERWENLNRIFRERGSTRTNDETNTRSPHWHLRFEFGAQGAQPPTTSPHNGSPAAVPGMIQAEQFDIGDNRSAYYIPLAGMLNPEEKPDDVKLYDAPGGSVYIGSTSGGQWMNYTVSVAATGNYTFETRLASATGGNTFHFEVDGVNKTGPIPIPNTGSAQNFQFVRVENISLDSGQRNVRLVIDGNGHNTGSFDYFTISPYDPAEICNPSSWELNSCTQSGGYWDYALCGCNYGPLGY